jgi:hypothetical protein
MFLQTTVTPASASASRRGLLWPGFASGRHAFYKVFWQLSLIGRVLLAMVFLALPATATALFFNPPV